MLGKLILIGWLLATGMSARAEFSPRDVEGLALWLDGDDVTRMEFVQGTSQLAAWHDKSEAGHRAQAAPTIEPPSHVPGGLNERGVVRFHGNHALLLGTPERLDLTGADDFSFFAVVNARSNGSILAKTDGSIMQYRFHIPGERTLRVALGREGDQRDTRSTVCPHQFRLLSAVNSERDGRQRFELFFDGQLEATGNAGSGRVDAPATRRGSRSTSGPSGTRASPGMGALMRAGRDMRPRCPATMPTASSCFPRVGWTW